MLPFLVIYLSLWFSKLVLLHGGTADNQIIVIPSALIIRTVNQTADEHEKETEVMTSWDSTEGQY